MLVNHNAKKSGMVRPIDQNIIKNYVIRYVVLPLFLRIMFKCVFQV